MYRRINGLTNEQIDGYMDRWMDQRMYVCMHACINMCIFRSSYNVNIITDVNVLLQYKIMG